MDQDEMKQSNFSKGKLHADQFTKCLNSLCKGIMDSFSLEEFQEMLSPFHKLDASKVKMKFDDFILQILEDELNPMFQIKLVTEKLDLLVKLKSLTPSEAASWRPTEEMINSKSVFRNYRTKVLKEEIEKITDAVNCEELSGRIIRTKLSTFLDEVKEIEQATKANENKLQTLVDIHHCNSLQMDKSLQNYHIAHHK